MKIDIVKPIPAINADPIIFFHFKSAGNEQIPKPAPINEKSQIPKGLPITSQAMIPKLFAFPKPLSQVSSKAMQVLAIATMEEVKKQLVCV